MSKTTKRLQDTISSYSKREQEMRKSHEEALQRTKDFREDEMKRLTRDYIDQIIDRIALLHAEGIRDDRQRLLKVLDDLENEVIPDRNCAALQSRAWPYPTPREVHSQS